MYSSQKSTPANEVSHRHDVSDAVEWNDSSQRFLRELVKTGLDDTLCLVLYDPGRSEYRGWKGLCHKRDEAVNAVGYVSDSVMTSKNCILIQLRLLKSC